MILLAVMHSLCLIHTDLKPENILLVSPEYIEVPNKKVFDVVPFDFLFCNLIRKTAGQVISIFTNPGITIFNLTVLIMSI